MRTTKSRQTGKTKTVPYDVAEQLRTPDEMAAYLDAWVEEVPGDVTGIATMPRKAARRGTTTLNITFIINGLL